MERVFLGITGRGWVWLGLGLGVVAFWGIIAWLIFG